MMKLMRQFIQPYQLMSGTITDEKFDYPEGMKHDSEGIKIYHAGSVPKRVNLNGREVIQVGMGLLSYNGDIETFKREYLESEHNEIFGIVTHERDFANNPSIIEEWLKFVGMRGQKIKSLNEIIVDYENNYVVDHSDSPMTFLNHVKSKEECIDKQIGYNIDKVRGAEVIQTKKVSDKDW